MQMHICRRRLQNVSHNSRLNPATIGTGNGLGGPAHFGGSFSLAPAAAA